MIKQFIKIMFALITIFSVSQCTDPCQDVNCFNGGECLDGLCLCPEFYEGPDCSIEERSSDSQGNTSSYADSKTISSSNKGAAYIKFDGDIYAILSEPGSGVFSIPSQASSNPVVWDSFFSGSGNFSSSHITYTIESENNGETLTISFSGTK
jgi:hypothetical protein